jgi:ribonucleoside-diphosphate reductase alpha chain
MSLTREFNLEDFRRHVLNDPLARDIWDGKYRFYKSHGVTDEQSVNETRLRVVNAIYAKDPNQQAKDDCRELVLRGELIPGGRINAGAGTGRKVTELNCYVLRTVQDSMPGIQLTIAEAALTMQQGGGIGVDFSTIRPAGAIVKRTGSVASGIIPFADQQDGMCQSITSAGTRRGAQMLTLACDHPDLWNEQQFKTREDHTGVKVLMHPSFISAKRQRGRLTQFNVSVLITDRFMQAIERDEMWDLGFHVPRADSQHVDVYEKEVTYEHLEYDNNFKIVGIKHKKGEKLPWYVYRRVPARRIWEDIMQSTYTYAEPGVIFIDRINARNNLWYCEDIRCCNPCGEQVLPPNGCCCLGSINTAFMVRNPFSPDAFFDFTRFAHAAHVGIRMLDNVLDIANFPLEAQKRESDAKRRIGLGITGWGDALVQLGLRYGSDESIALSRSVAKTLRDESYMASAQLAKERGAFPVYSRNHYLEGYNINRLPKLTQEMIAETGIRNSVLNTIAPNGTISMYVGNVSSGHEPVFSFNKTKRKVRQVDGSLAEYESVDYALRLYERLYPGEPLPDYFVGAMDISAEDHVRVHAAWQEFIDASVSKTINCATEMSYEEFKQVYQLSYDLGAKGCTTYRYDPTAGRGSVLSEAKEPEPLTLAPVDVSPRPVVLSGRTYKLKWPPTGDNWYITINNEDGVPREVFIETKDAQHKEWVTALARMLTGILRRGGSVAFIVEELEAVRAVNGAWINQTYVHSIVAAIGGVIRREFELLGILNAVEKLAATHPELVADLPAAAPAASLCPACNAPAWIKDAGCYRCLSCGHNTCS